MSEPTVVTLASTNPPPPPGAGPSPGPTAPAAPGAPAAPVLSVPPEFAAADRVAQAHERRANAVLCERLLVFNLFLVGFFGLFLGLALFRVWIAPFEGYDATWAALANVLALALAAGITLTLRRMPEPSPTVLQAAQWLTLIGLQSFCIWFTLEKLYDDADRIMSRFIVEHPVFAGCAYSFAWFGLLICYATFIPNRWRRLAVQMLTVVAVPPLVCAVMAQIDPQLSLLFSGSFYLAMLGVLLTGSATVVYSCYHENRLRQDVIEARRVGPYRLLEKLGEGGMGVVYKAEHQLVKRPCAIKFIHRQAMTDEDQRQRFFREFQALARLSHWNLVEVYDFGETPDGTCYYVMECLEGMSLEHLVRKYGALPPGRALYLLRQVCEALRMAHRLGLVHRDLKPSNLFLTSKNEVQDVVKVLDFGLVHDSQHALGGETLTHQGAIMGTPGYMAPEQIEGANQVDARSDIYSVGAVGYFLLAGKAPYSGRSAAEILVAQMMSDPPSLRGLQPNTPDEVVQVIERCLNRLPEQRFQTVEELLQAIDRCACIGQWSARQATQWHQNQLKMPAMPPAPPAPPVPPPPGSGQPTVATRS